MRHHLYLGVFLSAALLQGQSVSVEKAWDLIAKGDRAGAVRTLETILKTDSRNGEARLLLGSILAEEGKNREALEQLTAAATLMARSPMAQNALGEAHSTGGDLKAARAAFERATALDVSFAQAHANLGETLLKLNEPAQAANHLDRAIAIFGKEPDVAYPLYLRAKIYTDEGQLEKASAALRQAVTLQPNFAEAWSDLGQARKQLSDEAEALAAFQRAVAASPDNGIAQYRLGAEYLHQGNAEKALPHLRESFRIDPSNQSTLYSLQMTLRQTGRTEEAREIKDKLSEKLRRIDKDSQDAFTAVRLNNQGAALEKAGNLPAAMAKYRAARELNPEHTGIRVNYGVALLRSGKWKEGLAELREAARLDPADPKVKSALEDALRQAPKELR